MSEGAAPDRGFTDGEVRAILARAAELQVGQQPGEGTTLAQLKQAASELGLDPEVVERAASEVRVGASSSAGSLLFGGPWRCDFDRILPGRITAKEWPAIVEDIRATTGRVGIARDSGELFEWTSNSPYWLHVSISPSGQNSRVRVTGRFATEAILSCLFAGLIPIAVGLTCLSIWIATLHAVVLTPAALVALVVGYPVTGFLIARLATIPLAKWRNRQMREFLAFLERRIGQDGVASQLSNGAPLAPEETQKLQV